MIFLNIKLAFRSLLKRKLYSLANILGLAVGFLSFMSIMLYNDYELSYDEFHSKSDKIYRLWDTFNSNDRQSAMMPFKWTEYLSDEFAEIDLATTVQKISCVVKHVNDVKGEENVIAADSTFFKVFDYPIIRGKKSNLLINPNGIILEKETAERYFGDYELALGKELVVGFHGTFELFLIEAIVVSPKNSHLQFDIILPYEFIIKNHLNAIAYESFSTHFAYTYVVMNESPIESVLQPKFKNFLFKHGGEQLKKRYTTSFQPLKEVYLKSTQEFDFDPRGSYKNIQILSIVAWLVLVISSVNFVNLSTAQSIKRAKEVGVRKVFGSNKKTLIIQFLTESILVSLVSALLALIMVIILLPAINNLSSLHLQISDILNSHCLLIFSVLGLSVGFLAGIYPAFVLSSIDVLKIFNLGNSKTSSSAIARKGLIIFQFSIAIMLIIGTGVISKQLNYMLNSDLGIESEQVIIINDNGAVSDDGVKMSLLKKELSKINEVKAVSSASTSPGQQSWSIGFVAEGYDEAGSSLSCIFTDHDFISTFGIKIIEGRDLDINISSDSSGFLINKKAQELFSLYDSSWSTNPIGKNIKSNYLKMDGPVIGVFDDFHFQSLHDEIKPLIVMVYPKFKYVTQIRLSTNAMTSTLSDVSEVWKKLNPDIPFEYKFVDSIFSSNYKSDQVLSNLFRVFSFVAVILAIFGLFGLSSFIAKDKLRDICIRKVMGASQVQMMIKLGAGMLMLVIVGALLAMPIAFVAVSVWLEGFPYHIEVPLWIFGISLLLIIIISLSTTCYHAYRTVVTDPVIVLRQN